MIKVIMLLLFSFPSFASDSANFAALIQLLSKGTCADFQFWISATRDPDVFDFNVKEPTQTTPLELLLTSPVKSNTIRVHRDSVKNEIIYSESDMVGWVNLKVAFAGSTLTGFDLYKTLPGFDRNGVPNGVRYSQGPKCNLP